MLQSPSAPRRGTHSPQLHEATPTSASMPLLSTDSVTGADDGAAADRETRVCAAINAERLRAAQVSCPAAT